MSNSFMTEYPGRRLVNKSIRYTIVSFMLFPLWLSLMNIDGMTDYSMLVWLDIGYHCLNFIAAIVIFGGYLRESFFNVQVHTKEVIKTATIGCALMLTVAAVFFVLGVFTQRMDVSFGVFPLSEIEVHGLTSTIVEEQPVVGTILVTLLTPITICCLFYATIFTTISASRPVLAYIVIAVVLMVPRIVNVISFWPWQGELILYLIQLPIHLIACRICQKTDTIWTPIFALAAANLITCLLLLF